MMSVSEFIMFVADRLVLQQMTQKSRELYTYFEVLQQLATFVDLSIDRIRQSAELHFGLTNSRHHYVTGLKMVICSFNTEGRTYDRLKALQKLLDLLV